MNPESAAYYKLYLEGLLDMVRIANTDHDEEDLISIYKFILISHLKLDKFALVVREGETWVTRVQYGLEMQQPDFEGHLAIHTLKKSGRMSLGVGSAALGDFNFLVPSLQQMKGGKSRDSTLTACLFLAGVSDDMAGNKNLILFLETITQLVNLAIYNKRLLINEINQREYEKELEIATVVQRNLLPKVLPASEAFTVLAVSRAYKGVSGDYYDCIKLGPHKYLICLADVTGKGLPASILMANFQASLSILARIYSDLEQLATELNRIIFENTGGEQFITAFFGTIDLEHGVIYYLNAGHPAMVGSIDGAGPIKLDSNCTILGALPELPVMKANAIGFEKRAQFIGVTDGVEEMTNAAGDYFGLGPLEELFMEEDLPTLEANFSGYLAEIDAYKGDVQLADDMTVLAFAAQR